MKKIYQMPDMQVVEIASVQPILAGSETTYIWLYDQVLPGESDGSTAEVTWD